MVAAIRNVPSVTAATTDAVPPTPGQYTVDQVAEMTRTTVRTIRWYQSEGLLPPPRRAGRVAMYDAEHLVRLESIRDLQAHGLTLNAIRRLLERAPGDAGPTALAFVKTAVAQSVGDNAEVVTADEMAERLGLPAGTPVDPAIIRELGVAHEMPDGGWRITAPAAVEASAGLARLGVPMEARVELSRLFVEHTRVMAKAVVEMFLDYLMPPDDPSNTDPEVWHALSEAVARLRPLAATSVASSFDTALARAAERAAERVLDPEGTTPGAGDRAASAD
jgi:DNA-binding transcriptional MerR regulator